MHDRRRRIGAGLGRLIGDPLKLRSIAHPLPGNNASLTVNILKEQMLA